MLRIPAFWNYKLQFERATSLTLAQNKIFLEIVFLAIGKAKAAILLSKFVNKLKLTLLLRSNVQVLTPQKNSHCKGIIR